MASGSGREFLVHAAPRGGVRSECGVERLRRLADALGAGEMVGVIDVVVVEGALDTVDESGDAPETRFFVSSSRNMDSMSRAWRVRLETARWRASAVLKVARER